MADGNIDSLNIQISADAQRASRALDRLSSSLLGMDKAAKRLSGSGFGKISKNINSFSNSISKLDGIQIPDLSKAVQSLEKLGKVKVSDNGINKTVNALNRLFKTDLSKFNAQNFERITSSISALSKMPDVSSSVNRFVSSIARLANAGEKTGQSASSLKRLGRNLKEITKTFSGIRNISSEVNSFVSSIARLANAGGKTGQTAAGLKNLAKETLKFFEAMKNAPKISENTLRMTEALAKLASAGGRVGTATGSVSSALTKLSNISTKAGNLVKKAASKITSAIKSIGISKPHLDRASSGFGSLFRSILPLLGIRQMFSWAKEAMTLGSDIAEVENVVDVSFGSMADKAYEFAATAKEQFGLSELAAKNYAGTLMAMFNSSGVAQKEAADMSVTLAGLAGDLASFYNIDTDTAFYKLRAGISGETEPLKQLGINMNIVNLEAYAMSQGITKSYQEMSLAEQQLLRYNYIMAVTGAQQNDFARTSGSFANQLRLLTLNFQTLGATIGQGFIAAVLPAIQALNALMAVLQRAAEAFRNFMYVLTGYEGTGSQGGVVNEFAGLEDIGSAGETAAGGLDDATDSAKELKKALSVLSFDELNQLSDNSSVDLPSSSGGSGGGTGSGGGFGDLGNVTDAFGKSKLPEAVNEWAERMRKAFLDHDWDKLGEEIAWGINKGLQFVYDAISWDNVGPKITAFTTAFTQTFNSLVEHIDWDLMGRTVGAGINTLVNTFNQLITGIDWRNLGKSFATGVMGIVNEVNWTNLGNFIGNKFMIAWETLLGFVDGLDFKVIGSSLAEGFNGAIQAIDLKVVGTAIGALVSGVLDIFMEFTKKADWGAVGEEIANAINSFFRKFKFNKLASALNSFVNGLRKSLIKAISKVQWGKIFDDITDAIGNLELDTAFLLAIPAIDKLQKAINKVNVKKLTENFQKFKNLFQGNFFGNVKAEIIELQSKMNVLQKGVIGVVAVFGEFSLLKDAFYDLTSGGDNVVASLGKIAVGAGAAVAALKLIGLSNPFTAAITGATALVSAFVGINKAMNEIAQNSMFETLETTGTVTLEELGQVATDSFGKITEGVDTSIKKLNEIQTTRDSIDNTTASIDSIRIAIDNGAYSVSEKIPEIIEQFQSLLNQSKSVFEEEYAVIVGNMSGAWSDYLEAQGMAVPLAIAQLAEYRDKTNETFSSVESSFNLLTEQYKSGAISQEEFLEKANPLYEKLKAFNDSGTVDTATQKIRDYGGALDLSQYINGNSLDTSAFTSFVDTITNEATTQKEAVAQNGEETQKALDDLVAKFEAAGLDMSEFDFASLYGASEEQVASTNKAIDSAYTDAFDQIQYALLNQLPLVVENATSGYEELNPFQKLFTTKEGFVNEQINIWKENVLTPFSDSVQKGFEELGIEGEPWADEAAGKLINAIFDSSTSYSREGMPITIETLKGDWKTILDEALSGAAKAVDASNYGKATVEGYNSGVNDAAGTTNTAIQDWMDTIPGSIHDSTMNYGSPSKTAKEFGIDTVLGFNNGIAEKLSTTKTVIDKWMNSVKDSFSGKKSLFNNFGKEYMNEFMNGFSENFSKKFNIITNVVTKIENSFSKLENSLYYDGRNAAKSFADGIKSIHIPTPHLYISSWDYYDYGDGASFSLPRFSCGYYAKGGLFTRATLGVVGEDGDEAVLPLENTRTMSMIANSILDNVSGGLGLSKEEMRQAVSEGVAMAMMNNSQNQQPITVYAELKTESDEVLARAVTRGQQKLDYRTNPTSRY